MIQLKDFKFVAALVEVFKKIENDDKTKFNKFYSHSSESIYTTIMSNIQESSGKGSDWIFDSVIENNIDISKYNSWAGSSYIKLSKKVDHQKRGLINIQNMDDNNPLNGV